MIKVDDFLSSRLGQVVKIMIAVGVLLGYAIQFFVAIQIMYSDLSERKFMKIFVEKCPVITELMFRSLIVLVTFFVAEIIPNLGVLLSLIGSVCCVVLVFVLPVLCEMIILSTESHIGAGVWIKNIIIFTIAFIGFVAGIVVGAIQVADVVINAWK